MKFKKVIGLMLVFCIFAFAFSGCTIHNKEEINPPIVSGDFEISILKVGKADAMILKTENHCLIIDCGEKGDGSKMTELLAEKNVEKLDYIFITHFDKDHVGGFPKLTEYISADNIIVPDYEGNNSEYDKYLESIEKNNLNITVLKDKKSFILDDVFFEVSVPKKKDYKESDNDFSLAVSVTHGDNTFLFAGDAEEERLKELMTEFNHSYDFLKVPHHGRYNEVTKSFAEVIKPKYSVICDSDKNPADDKTTEVLKNVGSEVFSTRYGNITVKSNGRDIKIIQSDAE